MILIYMSINILKLNKNRDDFDFIYTVNHQQTSSSKIDPLIVDDDFPSNFNLLLSDRTVEAEELFCQNPLVDVKRPRDDPKDVLSKRLIIDVMFHSR